MDSLEQGDLPFFFLFCPAFELGGGGAALYDDQISVHLRRIKSSYYVPSDCIWEREPLAIDLSVVISRSAGAISVMSCVLFRDWISPSSSRSSGGSDSDGPLEIIKSDNRIKGVKLRYSRRTLGSWVR